MAGAVTECDCCCWGRGCLLRSSVLGQTQNRRIPSPANPPQLQKEKGGGRTGGGLGPYPAAPDGGAEEQASRGGFLLRPPTQRVREKEDAAPPGSPYSRGAGEAGKEPGTASHGRHLERQDTEPCVGQERWGKTGGTGTGCVRWTCSGHHTGNPDEETMDVSRSAWRYFRMFEMISK